jgi:Uma2 family endonuclease
MSTATTHPKFTWEEGVEPPKGLRMTEEEFLNWIHDEIRAEWVDGEVIVMAPANFEHNDLNWWLLTLLRIYVERKDLGVVIFDYYTRFSRPRRQLRVPDVLFVSKDRRHLVKRTRLEGPPDLAMEIISPDSEARDWREKYNDYQAAGVREYWIISPATQKLEVYTLGPDQTYAPIAEADGKLSSLVVPGWYIRPVWLFSDPRPNVLDILPELGIR